MRLLMQLQVKFWISGQEQHGHQVAHVTFANRTQLVVKRVTLYVLKWVLCAMRGYFGCHTLKRGHLIRVQVVHITLDAHACIQHVLAAQIPTG